MATAPTAPELRIGQLWTVWLLQTVGFIGELTWIHEDGVAFVIHAILGQNLQDVVHLLGQVIVVPRQNPLWEFLGGPR